MHYLLQIRHEGELVAEAPLIIHDATKTRAAVMAILEEGRTYGMDAGLLGSVLAATSKPSEPDNIGVALFHDERWKTGTNAMTPETSQACDACTPETKAEDRFAKSPFPDRKLY